MQFFKVWCIFLSFTGCSFVPKQPLEDTQIFKRFFVDTSPGFFKTRVDLLIEPNFGHIEIDGNSTQESRIPVEFMHALDAKCVMELNVMEAFPKWDLRMHVVQGKPVCNTCHC